MAVSKTAHFKSLLCIALFLVSLGFLEARPISYPNSWTIMQQHNWEKTLVHVHYSPNAKNSIGILSAYYQEEKDRLTALQWNHLLYRKNQKKSQANLYTKIHLGRLEREIGQTNVSHSAFNLSFDSTSFHQKTRIGIAPYVAPYGKLHTWLMLQIEHHPDDTDSDNRIIITPMVRFFKGDYLCEIGLNSNNQILFNSIIRF